MTRYPKSGKNTKWTIKELDSVPQSWANDFLSDGGGLRGEVRVSAAGEVSILFKYGFKYNGKFCWHYCGAYPSSDLSLIRKTRDEAKALVAKGIDPRAQKKASKIEAQQAVEAIIKADETRKAENLTVQDLFSVWTKDGVARLDSNKALIQQFGKWVLPEIGLVPIRELTEPHLMQLLRKINDTGKHRTVDAMAKDIKQMFKWAEKRQPFRRLLIDGNPADLINLDAILPEDFDGVRDRILSDAEIFKLQTTFETLRQNYNSAEKKYSVPRPVLKETELAIWICLSTICRIGELLKSEWAHVDFDKRLWFLPKENTKGKRGKRQNHYVYLSDFAMRQFQELHKLTGSGRWLFPASNAKKNETEIQHISINSISKQVGDRQSKFKNHTRPLKNRAINNDLVVGEREWTPHDLRRTGSTIMQRMKISNEVINRCQNHAIFGSNEKINLHYLHYEHKPEMQDAWEKLGGFLNDLLSKN